MGPHFVGTIYSKAAVNGLKVISLLLGVFLRVKVCYNVRE